MRYGRRSATVIRFDPIPSNPATRRVSSALVSAFPPPSQTIAAPRTDGGETDETFDPE